ncbi:glycoside hydrolase family 99-like domain-containing protein [Mucilaginibacter mali]|uniref:Glycoside hydrolase family 99-like domain-containing protein n=1 Tax=Mucilaginibacter mali TaxID=2740462 RepID=A0A7D4UPZ1_9SPHI|nr:glycoside hydrolase family 99-like domain-containing protein [Mucilaginibacter mali]QKJ31480.1 glycoside hydrolase family 99-like domain-containing protein [Mucilaginibacter mali]
MVKIIAFHLPQFHPIPENDEWWGEGFTEWTNTKKCKPAYKGHYQPKEPLDNNYYNLLDKDALLWQADLAKKYGIYGFCFYHYWFKGRQLLEKPLEIYLANKDIDLPFCFSWANHSWTRTWVEKKDILLEQTYGSLPDWEKHFYFLLPYFKDERYIKINGKPVFMFNRPLDFAEANNMIDRWDQLAVENGLTGIYFIETLSPFQTTGILKRTEALVEYEPTYTYNFLPFWYKVVKKLGTLTSHKVKPVFNSYSYFWHLIINRKPLVTDKKLYPGAFVNWDNHARRPTAPIIFLGFSLARFRSYMIKQIVRSKKVYHSEYLFINAWNEWAEGNTLEPDKKYKYGILEALQSAIKAAKSDGI